MIYLPSRTSDAVLMEGTNPDGSKKLWIGAFASDGGSRDIVFTCWKGHENVPDVIWQGKTIARGPGSKRRYQAKIEEKELKGYRILSGYTGHKGTWTWHPENTLLPIPTSVQPGICSSSGCLHMIRNSDNLMLDLFKTPQGIRLDQREWTGMAHEEPDFPDWQTLYPDMTAALTAAAAVQSGREQKGMSLRVDSLPWEDLDAIAPAPSNMDWVIGGSSLVWDF